MREFLTVAEVVAFHADLIRRYGGASGIRDRALLDSAVARPQQGYYSDLIEEAAALWESLAQNHPFIDGNKRVAFAATLTFLAINGANIDADADTAFAFIDGLYQAGSFDFENLEAWLRLNVSAIES